MQKSKEKWQCPDFHRSNSISIFPLCACLTGNDRSIHQRCTCSYTCVTERVQVTFTRIHQQFILLCTMIGLNCWFEAGAPEHDEEWMNDAVSLSDTLGRPHGCRLRCVRQVKEEVWWKSSEGASMIVEEGKSRCTTITIALDQPPTMLAVISVVCLMVLSCLFWLDELIWQVQVAHRWLSSCFLFCCLHHIIQYDHSLSPALPMCSCLSLWPLSSTGMVELTRNGCCWCWWCLCCRWSFFLFSLLLLLVVVTFCLLSVGSNTSYTTSDVHWRCWSLVFTPSSRIGDERWEEEEHGDYFLLPTSVLLLTLQLLVIVIRW